MPLEPKGVGQQSAKRATAHLAREAGDSIEPGGGAARSAAEPQVRHQYEPQADGVGDSGQE